MKRLFPAFALFCAAPFAVLPQQASALEESDRDDPYYYYSALMEMQNDAMALDVETRREDIVRLFLQIADEAATAQKRFANDTEEVQRFAELQGTALYYAAENHEFDSADAEARAREVSWIINGIDVFERVLPDDLTGYFPFYEYTGLTALLFQHGAWLGDPRLPAWSLANVRAERAALASYAASTDDPAKLVAPKNALAQALLESGFATKDKASIDEANAILDMLGEDDVDYFSYRMREAVAEGRAPYPAPGEDY